MKERKDKRRTKKSIFRSLFAPMFAVMLIQAFLFYFAAVYGGIEESLTQNAVDILNERLYNRQNEILTRFNGKWADLDECRNLLGNLYNDYQTAHGAKPFIQSNENQINFLGDASDILIKTLRRTEVNGIFLIINNEEYKSNFEQEDSHSKYGLCIRDMDQESYYNENEDLLLERSPYAIADTLGCTLDSWWEAKYSFESASAGDYYYEPLRAAWENKDSDGEDLAYFSGRHRISGADPAVVSYSIPLMDEMGYPYGVVGVEISASYLASLMPNAELNAPDRCCYLLALSEDESTYVPIVYTGAMHNRLFDDTTPITVGQGTSTGGSVIKGRGGVRVYTSSGELKIYNSNNPFEQKKLFLLAMVEEDTLFAYIGKIKLTLLIVSVICLMIGVGGLLMVSRHMAEPITALAEQVRGIKTRSEADFKLGRIGITEIDFLVDSIEELNYNVNKSSARTEFFSRMSHDMRTPMNAIIGFSSPQLLEDAPESVKDDYLQKIHASGEYLLGLINEVLDITKIESDKTQIVTDTVRANMLFETTLPIIEELAAKGKLIFNKQIDIPDEVFVKADEQHINQIVMNLLSNAVKFTPAGGRVSFEAYLEEIQGEKGLKRCVITVADTGIGMSEEFMKNLYVPFEQENSRREGTGLGLSIAKKLIELMGGNIDCQSKLNEGTAFTVSLPLALSEQAPPPSKEHSDSPAADITLLKGKRVLICEDNEINIQLMQDLLDKAGIITVTARDGKEGLDIFAASKKEPFDAILMDIRMPVMDGLEATSAIRALPEGSPGKIPIIAMTANAFDEDVDAGRAAGMDAHLTKPVNPLTLYETLINYTVKSEASDKI